MGSRLRGYTYTTSNGGPFEVAGEFTFDDDVFPLAVAYAQVNQIAFEIASYRGMIRGVKFGPRTTDYVDVSMLGGPREVMPLKTEGTATVVIVPEP